MIDMFLFWLDSLSDGEWIGFVLLSLIGLYCLGMGFITRSVKWRKNEY